MRNKGVLIFSSIIFLFFTSPVSIYASPLIVSGIMPVRQNLYFPNETKLPDPSVAGTAAYGYLNTPFAVDSYYFVPAKNTVLSIEVDIPVRYSNINFRPTWEIIGPNISPQPMAIEFSIPPGSNDIGHDYYIQTSNRYITMSSITGDRVYIGNQQHIPVLAHKLYYLNIFEPYHYLGDYVLKINNPVLSLHNLPLREIALIKLNMVGQRVFPHLDFLGVLLILLGITFGFGTFLFATFIYMFKKIDMMSIKIPIEFFQWIGVFLCINGYMILYRNSWLSGIASVQAIIFFILIGGLFLWNKVFSLSIFSHFILVCNLLGWVSELFLFAWYLLIWR